MGSIEVDAKPSGATKLEVRAHPRQRVGSSSSSTKWIHSKFFNHRLVPAARAIKALSVT